MHAARRLDWQMARKIDEKEGIEMDELYDAARQFLAAWETDSNSVCRAYRIGTTHALFAELYYAQYDEHIWDKAYVAANRARELLPEIERCTHCGGWPTSVAA